MASVDVLVTALVATLAGLSLVCACWQWAEARRFPLNKRIRAAIPPAGVTVLKPLKGCDSETRLCLSSWLQQDYPAPVQFLCGVASADDPACELVRELIEEFPHCEIHLIICAERLGANGKVSTLAQLEGNIAHEWVVLSDADVLVPRDFLSQIMATCHETSAALVHCFYALANPANLSMQLEALAVNADFWPQVLQSRRLAPLDFALGAALLTHRDRLRAIGGIRAVADYLADDFQLGLRLARLGGQIRMCRLVVECRQAPQSPAEVWRHQLRWARTVRACRPIPYFFSILNNVTCWHLLLLGGAQLIPVPARLAIFIVGCVLRIMGALDAERRLIAGSAIPRSRWWMPLVKDLLGVCLWGASFLGNTVHWRGERFRIGGGGRLVACDLRHPGVRPAEPGKGQVAYPRGVDTVGKNGEPTRGN